MTYFSSDGQYRIQGSGFHITLNYLERVPVKVLHAIIDKAAREISDAIEKGKEQKGNLVEHQDGDGSGEAAKAKRGDCPF